MFARWRNLAAAAGAIWFPFACAQASPDRNEIRCDSPCTRPGACAGFHDRAANPWQNYDREAWYQQYYRNSLNDPTSVSEQSENSPSFETNYTTGNDDIFADQYVPEFNEPEIPVSDEPAAVLEPRIEETTPVIDSDGRCDDPTCPCHDIIDLDSDDQPNPSNASSFDVYETYSFEVESSNDSLPDAAPKARLNGTIEPIFEECDEQTTDDSIELLIDATIDSPSFFDDAEATSTSDDTSDAAMETQDATEDQVNGSADQKVRFHMFYPGCNWSQYQPVECGQGAGMIVSETEPTLPDSNDGDSEELPFQVD